MGFQKAVRENVWLRVLLSGPSGSGKTYSALKVATGLARCCNSRIAAIDTENGRIRYYANEFDFDDMQLQAPFQPEKFVAAINEAVRCGYKVIIVDSSSHEWKWCYETVNAMPGNNFQNWGKIKAQHHEKFKDCIMQAPAHLIVTARGKDEYVLDDKDGKKTPRKVGAGMKAEDDTEYDYTVTFNISQDTHVATTMKDNTHYFETRYEPLTEEDGEILYKWANSGIDVAIAQPKSDTGIAEAKTDVSTIFDPEEAYVKIGNVITAKKNDGVAVPDISAAIKAVCGVANYKKFTDRDTLLKVFDAVNKLTATIVAE